MNSSPIFRSSFLLIALFFVSMMISTTTAFLSTSSMMRQTQTQAQAPVTTSQSSTSLSFAPVDIGGIATLLSLKVEGVSSAVGVCPAQLLSDASYVVMDAPTIFPNSKVSTLRLRYAQVCGRLLIVSTSFLPHHHGVLHLEEMAVQLFLLGVSMKPILRSIQLYQCITAAAASTTGNCEEECVLELEDLEAVLTIKNDV